jgi:cell division GTPase FtsZ
MQYLLIINERYTQLQNFNSFFNQLNNPPNLYNGGHMKLITRSFTNTKKVFTKLKKFTFDDLLNSFNDIINFPNQKLKIIIDNISPVSNNYIIDIIHKKINKEFKLIKTDFLSSFKKNDKIKSSSKKFKMDIQTQAKKYNEIFKHNMQQTLYKKDVKDNVSKKEKVNEKKPKIFIEI